MTLLETIILTLGREDAADIIAVTSLQEANSADQTRGSGNCEEQARDPGDTCHETRGYWALFHTWLPAPWDDLILGLVEKLQSHFALRYNKYIKQAVKSCRQSRALTHFPCCQPSKAPTYSGNIYTHPSMKFLCFIIPRKEWHDIGAASLIRTLYNSLTHRLTSSKYEIKGMKHHSLEAAQQCTLGKWRELWIHIYMNLWL